MNEKLDSYVSIDYYIKRLGYRIDCIHQPFLNANIPALWGHRLSKMCLPDEQLKRISRVWQVGIYTDNDVHGVKVFEGKELLEALQKAVAYVEGEE